MTESHTDEERHAVLKACRDAPESITRSESDAVRIYIRGVGYSKKVFTDLIEEGCITQKGVLTERGQSLLCEYNLTIFRGQGLARFPPSRR